MAKDNKALPTVDIKGKPYVLTQHRLLEFHRLYPNGSILTEIVSETEDSVVMITKVMPDAKVPERVFTGIASETKGSTFINKTSHYENCETSSRARALSGLGIGVEESCASAEEVANAMMQQSEIDTIKNLKPSIYKLVKLVGDSHSWLNLAFDFGVVDKKKFESILNTIFDGNTCGNVNQNVSNLEKQLDSKLKQLKESEKFVTYEEQVSEQNKKVNDALEAFEK
jgi:hypothetical protein